MNGVLGGDRVLVNKLSYRLHDPRLGDLAATVVPDGHVFVMGDNRCCSGDSRSPALGTVDVDDIVGRAFVVFWPIGHWHWL